MKHGLSDQVRAAVEERYVFPAIRSGKLSFSVAVRDLMGVLQTMGFPAKNWPQICTAIQTEKFLRANGLEIESVDGPPSKLSTTVVVHYRVIRSAGSARPSANVSDESDMPAEETPEAKALRLTGKLRGLLKDEIAAHGGGEAFLRWVRGYDEEDAA